MGAVLEYFFCIYPRNAKNSLLSFKPVKNSTTGKPQSPILGKPQKNNGLFLVAQPLRGGGGKGLATKKKALVVGPLKKDHFLRLPLFQQKISETVNL